MQTTAVPPHVPPLQVSFVVQALPSSHGAVLFACWHPACASQLSSVQELWSSQSSIMPGWQLWFTHVSKPVQMFMSSQSPAATQQSGTGACMHPIPWSQKSVVQGEPSSQSTGACWQPRTASQVSVVQALPSLQSSPMGAEWHMPVVVSQVSAPSQTVSLVQSESC